MDNLPFNPCALIPVYNHSQVLTAIVAELVALQLPVILVDDGSDTPCKAVIEAIIEKFPAVTLVARQFNGGKGAAMKDGLRTAFEMGYSHAVQIDADGQHNRGDIPRFLTLASLAPESLVCAYPIYDESIPKHRLYGRYATHIWVWINTLSMTIKDSMCGFRVYPLRASCLLLDESSMGNRMDFDGEFVVRWFWSGGSILQQGTEVTYPLDGISHFRLWRDNGLISWMHARLFFGMLVRSPLLLFRKLRNNKK
ncbi:MAG: glycosyltransferase family 2 protein [Gammaproteobacteria bacterium]|nr:glycosyltransferase family 2 protein [Gammaproteobacteria bacterium]